MRLVCPARHSRRCLCRLTKGGRCGGVELQSGNLSRNPCMPGVRRQRSIRCDGSPLCHRLELFGGKRALFVSVCISEKVVCHLVLSVKRVEGKNGKRRCHRQKTGVRHVLHENFPLYYERAVRNRTRQWKGRTFTPKPSKFSE